MASPAEDAMRGLSAALTWGADRLRAELDALPQQGRYVRAGWAVDRLRLYAAEAAKTQLEKGEARG